MTVIEVKAIVIRTVDYGENDKLLTLLTEEKGCITASVRGSRSLKSRYFSSVQLFCYSRFILTVRNDRYYIREAELLDNFFSIGTDLEKTALAAYICEAIGYVAVEEPDPSLFRLSLNTLYAISKLLYPLPKIKAAFEMRAAGILGFMPDVSACAICGRQDGDFVFDIMNGVILCDECRKHEADIRKPTLDDDYREAHIVALLNTGAKNALVYVLSCPMERLLSFRLEKEEQRLFSIAAETYFLNQIERSFPSLEFYKNLIRTGDNTRRP